MSKIKKPSRCKRCGKRWCGTGLRLVALYPFEPWMWGISHATIACRNKGSKR